MNTGRLQFRTASAPPTSPNRTDVACVVGWIGVRSPADDGERDRREALATELSAVGYTNLSATDPKSFQGVPVRCDSLAEFEAWFAQDRRVFDLHLRAGVDDSELHRGVQGTTWTAVAVRAFFREGGRRIYVVALDGGPPYFADDRQRRAALERLVPGSLGEPTGSTSVDPMSWSGIEHVRGVEDVSLLLVPDLPELCAAPPELPGPEPASSGARFEVCGRGTLPRRAVRWPSPRSDDRIPSEAEGGPLVAGASWSRMQRWARTVTRLREFLRRHAPTVQAVLALPRALDGRDLRILDPDTQVAVFPVVQRRDYFAVVLDGEAEGVHDRDRIQIAHPWLRSDGKSVVPGDDLPPDGALAGILAREALAQGTFRSIGGAPVRSAAVPVEELGDLELERPVRYAADAEAEAPLRELLTVLIRSPRGFVVGSDAMPIRDGTWRHAAVDRLLAAIVRAARRLGEGLVFENHDARLRSQVELEVRDLLTGIWRAGGLRGRTAAEAFDVRCDATTTTADDLVNGRVIARITVRPAFPIDAITVDLALQHDGSARVEVPA